MAKKSRLEIARAAQRLAADASLQPLSDLLALLNAPTFAVAVRWVTNGRYGVYLDAIVRDGKWMSSTAAIARFQNRCRALGH